MIWWQRKATASRKEIKVLRPRVLRGDELRLRQPERTTLEPEQRARAGLGPAVMRAGVAPATACDGRRTYASLLIHEGRSMP
jgi:hypothetical protein